MGNDGSNDDVQNEERALTPPSSSLWRLFSLPVVMVLSGALRVLLLLYGDWQDQHMQVRFTDIDYMVFTDAARAVHQGGSPYSRATYRYTPLLAMMLTPNISLHRSFGKLLFIAADLVVGWLLYRALHARGLSALQSLCYASIWLLNPFVMTISARGNAESVLAALVVGSLVCLSSRVSFVPAAVLFGAAVHFKIYPVIYVFSVLAFLDDDYIGKRRATSSVSSQASQASQASPSSLSSQASTSSKTALQSTFSISRTTLVGLIGWFNWARISFGLISFATFAILNAAMYWLFGNEFIEHAFLYHVTRTDHRHNFSIYFYHLYMSMDQPQGLVYGLLAFLPQLIVVAAIGVRFGKDLYFSCFAQTFAFVTFNKVCTSQYFLWYLCLYPLIIPFSRINFFWKGLILTLAWVAAQALWLNFGYELEFLGHNRFTELWISGAIFFAVNVTIICQFVLNHQYRPIFGDFVSPKGSKAE